MLNNPMDVPEQFPVRKSKNQKQAFRDAAQAYAENQGYAVTVEKGSMGAQNIVIGDPENAKYLVTAHYDTPARMFFPNFITPCNFIVYLAYQLLVVGMLLIVSFAAAIAVEKLLDAPELGLLIWYIVYFGILLLMMFGPANRHNANDNTSGVVTVLEILRSLPENQRNKVCFVLFDLEEAGLVGSSSYRKAHKAATEKQVILNLDCIGDGDILMMFPNKKLKKDPDKLAGLERICGTFGEKSLKLHRKGFAVCPSDHKNFPLGVGIMAFHRRKVLGLYCDRIHTNRDTVLEQTNVNILRAALTTLICQ